jgi:hypothetical protein
MRRDPTASGSVLPPASRAGIRIAARLRLGCIAVIGVGMLDRTEELKAARDSYDEGQSELTPKARMRLPVTVFSLSELCHDYRTLS